MIIFNKRLYLLYNKNNKIGQIINGEKKLNDDENTMLK